MSTRCVACRKPVKRGQLFCPDCLEKRAPASARRRERRRLGQLLELILSLPFLAASKHRAIVITEDAWNDTRQEIRSNPKAKTLFIEAAASIGIEPSGEFDVWIAGMNAHTAKPIVAKMVTIDKKRSGRYKVDVFDVRRCLLALSSSLLSTLVVALALLSLVLLIIG